MSETLEQVFQDKSKLAQLFSYMVSIATFLGSDKMLQCPFHPDKTPSSRMYEDEDGVTRLFCFSCRRQFTSYDYVVKILEVNPVEYLKTLFSEKVLRDRVSLLNFVTPVREPKFNLDELKEVFQDSNVSDLMEKVYLMADA